MQFVKQYVSRYAVSIGIGDSHREDFFIQQCTIGLLVVRAPSILLPGDEGASNPHTRAQSSTDDDAIFIRRLTTAARIIRNIQAIHDRERLFSTSLSFALGLFVAAIATLYATGRLPVSIFSQPFIVIAHNVVIVLTVVLVPVAVGIAAHWIYDRLFRRRRASADN